MVGLCSSNRSENFTPERIIDIKPEIILNPNSLYNSEIKDRLNQINYSCEVIDIFK